MTTRNHEWSAKERKEPSELASAIARDIFSMGDHPLNDDKAHRIEFKGGHYPDGETDLGGLCEKSLADRIDASLRDAAQTGHNPTG